ncbi:MAG: DUF3109 family protein [Bacteroidota bacterium]
MLQIDNKILSLDIIEKKFVCDVERCKGACCVHGDSGAPLEDNEVTILEEEYRNIKPFLRKEGVEAIENQGIWVVDSDNDKVTPLVNNNECAYVVFDNGIAKCGIEKAYTEGATYFQKPVSCHLYPIRTKKHKEFEGMNYDTWDICKPALKLGERLNVPVYVFVKDALIRKYGKDWYQKLKIAVNEIEKEKGNK